MDMIDGSSAKAYTYVICIFHIHFEYQCRAIQVFYCVLKVNERGGYSTFPVLLKCLNVCRLSFEVYLDICEHKNMSIVIDKKKGKTKTTSKQIFQVSHQVLLIRS